MMMKQIARFFYTKSSVWAVEKSQLAALRKKTGYTFTNCKKALELHDNNLTKAENWLKEQAQALGWSKATKLEGRATTQGLIAVAVDNNNAALVEINCETDFVARNDTFKSMAEMAAKACLNESRKLQDGQQICKVELNMDNLKLLNGPNGKSLTDHLALMIGTVGENAAFRRGLCLKADNNYHIYGYAHPSGDSKGSVLLGRIGGIVALEQIEKYEEVDMTQVGKDLCQHVVGMSPKKVGDENDEPAKDNEDEECLIYQEYINDNSILVKDYLQEVGVRVVDFHRLECGERQPDPLDRIETCQ